MAGGVWETPRAHQKLLDGIPMTLTLTILTKMEGIGKGGDLKDLDDCKDNAQQLAPTFLFAFHSSFAILTRSETA